MDLMESIKGNIRGITLNSQNIDLFNILENTRRREETIEKVYEYLSEILLASNMEAKGMSTDERIKKL